MSSASSEPAAVPDVAASDLPVPVEEPSVAVVPSSSDAHPPPAPSLIPVAPPLAVSSASSSSSSAAASSRFSSDPPAAVAFAAPAVPCESYAPVKKSSKHVEPTATLKLLTWNVWFDAFHCHARMTAIGSVVLQEQPHFVALQEMTHKTLALIRTMEWTKKYFISHAPNNKCWYFTLLLSKFPFVSLQRRAYESNTKRDLLYAHIDVPTPAVLPSAHADAGATAKNKAKDGSVLRRVVIATSHLESSAPHRRLRLGQLDLALNWLGRGGGGGLGDTAAESDAAAPIRTAVFCGDMNLQSGEGDGTLVRHPEWVDSWMALYGQDDPRAAHRDGTTFCSKTNGMVGMNDTTGWSARLDRVFVRLEGGKQPEARSPAVVAPDATSASVAAPPASSASASSSSSSSAAAADWRIASVERLGLCALDLDRPHEYAQTKPYKQPVEIPAAAPRPTTTAGSAAPIVFPSDHFGMLLTLQLAEGAPVPSTAQQPNKDKCCIC